MKKFYLTTVLSLTPQKDPQGKQKLCQKEKKKKNHTLLHSSEVKSVFTVKIMSTEYGFYSNVSVERMGKEGEWGGSWVRNIKRKLSLNRP